MLHFCPMHRRQFPASKTGSKTNCYTAAMPRAEDFRARSRSRSRTRSSSHHAARHRHPMSLWPQPSSVGTIRAWVTLAREIYYLRSTVAFIGLIIASIVNLPIQLSAASTNIIGTITWMRHNTYQSAPPVDIATEGTQWLRHHRQPGHRHHVDKQQWWPH